MSFFDLKEQKQEKPRIMEDLIDTESKEWYYTGKSQVLVPINALNETGKKHYEEICSSVEEQKEKAFISDAIFLPISSGLWHPYKKSPFYNEKDCIILNYKSDMVLTGKHCGKEIKTSRIVWKGDDWVITESGSLYRFELALN